MATHLLFDRTQAPLCGQKTLSKRPLRSCHRSRLVTCAHNAVPDQVTDRRSALGLLAGVATLLNVQPSHAAFGDAANVFGKPSNTSGIIPYRGKGFTVDLPSKWGPSNEKEGQKNVILRYEDTGDAVNNVLIFKVKAGKGNVTDYGDPAAFLKDVKGIFGENVWQGATISEGGFRKDQVSAASLIDSKTEQKDGRTYYKLQVLTRTADGNEGGRHNLISATVNGGDLWICKVQIGDKRWFKGASKQGQAVYNTFSVA